MDAYPALAALLFEHLAVPMVSAPELLATANISGKNKQLEAEGWGRAAIQVLEERSIAADQERIEGGREEGMDESQTTELLPGFLGTNGAALVK